MRNTAELTHDQLIRQRASGRLRYYERKNNPRYIAIQKKANAKMRASRRVLINQLKDGGCNMCGYNKNYSALQFHHINQDAKEYVISDLYRIGNINKLKEEIKKCVLVCANCHAEIHRPDMMRTINGEPSDDIKCK